MRWECLAYFGMGRGEKMECDFRYLINKRACRSVGLKLVTGGTARNTVTLGVPQLIVHPIDPVVANIDIPTSIKSIGSCATIPTILVGKFEKPVFC